MPPGRLDVVVSAVEPATTVDRRYADTVELPAAIAELELPGLPQATAVADSSASVACTGVLAVDGSAQEYSFELTGQQAIDGTAAIGQPCATPTALAAGTHRVESLDIGLPVDVDRVVMSDRADEPAAVASADPRAIVTEDGRLRKTIEIDDCVDGCWLVLGNGYSTAWKATGPDGSLGDPRLVDGGFNGWRIAAVGSTGAGRRRMDPAAQARHRIGAVATRRRGCDLSARARRAARRMAGGTRSGRIAAAVDAMEQIRAGPRCGSPPRGR